MYAELRLSILQMLDSFQTALEQDLRRAHIFILEEKRGYSPAILVGGVRKIVQPKVLPYLSTFTLTNLQDAGAALVFDHFTSSGFLTMRAVEETARQYYCLVTGEPAVMVNVNDDRKFVTLGEMSWKLGKKLELLRSAKSRTGKLGLAVPHLAALCQTYRNPLSHPEIVKLDEDEAIDVFIKGIDVISTMTLDVIAGGTHFEVAPSALDVSWKR